MSTDAELKKWTHQPLPETYTKLLPQQHAEGYGISTSPWPSPGCAECPGHSHPNGPCFSGEPWEGGEER